MPGVDDSQPILLGDSGRCGGFEGASSADAEKARVGIMDKEPRMNDLR